MKEVIVIVIGGFFLLIGWTLYACIRVGAQADLQMKSPEAYKKDTYAMEEAGKEKEDSEISEESAEESAEDSDCEE